MTKKKGEEPKREWTPHNEAIFFDHLARSCCTRKAAKAAGMDERRVYDRRLRDAPFDERFLASRSNGYLRVEERLILDALGEADEEDGGGPMTDSERELALNLLKFHHGAVGRPHAGGTPPKRVSQEETDAAILARLAAVRRRLDRDRGSPSDD